MNIVKSARIGLLVLAAVSFSLPAWACEGEAYNESLEVIYESLYAGYEMGMTGDVDTGFRKMAALNERMARLPLSCQQFIQYVSDGMSSTYSPSTTSCHGSVCCDGTSCYAD